MTTPTRLSDRYALLEPIAAGGMGEVWRGRDDVLHRIVAVKIIAADRAGEPAFRQRFLREARHAAQLSHPGIATVYDYGESGTQAFLVMEYVDGEPLSAVLARRGRLPAPETCDIVGQVALALDAAHQAGVVHRDVKPGNLICRSDGVVKVTDFGIARSLDATTLTDAHTLLGTAAYLSPEQAEGKPAQPASDLYSLGVVAYECLAGRRPFTAESPAALLLSHLRDDPAPLPDVPPDVAGLVMALLRKDPRRRPDDAGEVGRTALALAVPPAPAAPTATAPIESTPTATLPQPAPTVAELPDPAQRRMRNRFIVIGALVVVIGLVLLKACGGGSATATVPRVVGDKYVDAVKALQAVGLRTGERRTPDSRAAGTVLRQSASPGEHLKAGSKVTLTVSSGPARTTSTPVEPASPTPKATTQRHGPAKRPKPGGGPKPGKGPDHKPGKGRGPHG